MNNPLNILLLLVLAVPAAVADSDLVMEDAWVRALPPTQRMTAAYLTLHNRGASPLEITGGRAELASSVEIHTTREVEGYQRMEQLASLALPAGASVTLAPGGTHLMLLGLERMPQPGETIELCLVEASGAQFCTRAPVRKSAGWAGHDHHQHH